VKQDSPTANATLNKKKTHSECKISQEDKEGSQKDFCKQLKEITA
jgi:hypothetical protein